MLRRFLSIIVLFCAAVSVAYAAEILPAFTSATAGNWSIDRYAPNSFTLGAGTLDIGISNTDGAAGRPAGQQGMFYNTQGKFTAITGSAGDSLSAQLFVPRDWASPSGGARRTDMWGVMVDAANAVSDYPIIGFTNSGNNGFVGFRFWTSLGAWSNLANPVNYGEWNTLSFVFTGTAYDYYVNGVLAAIDLANPTTVGFKDVIMQAYNFNDPVNFPNAVANDYTAKWRNTVPEPSSIARLFSGIGLLGFMRRRN